MQPDDMAAIFKEGRGAKIFDKKVGELLEHSTKAKEVQNSLRNLIVSIKDRLKFLENGGQSNLKEFELLQERLSRLSKVKDKHLEIMKESKCLINPVKLKN